jgi:hypothetical protein
MTAINILIFIALLSKGDGDDDLGEIRTSSFC